MNKKSHFAGGFFNSGNLFLESWFNLMSKSGSYEE